MSADAAAGEVVAERLALLRARIAEAGRDPAAVRVVAVTKGFGAGAVEAARAAGLDDLGENFAVELLAKAAGVATAAGIGATGVAQAAELVAGAELIGAAGEAAAVDRPVRWHFLGAVQRNKIARLSGVVACWQSVDRLVEAEAIARHRPGASVLVEVDCTGLPGRGGVDPDAVPALVEQLCRLELDVAGLMTVAPPGGGEPARLVFERVAGLVARLGLREASMGMSDDLDEALRAGSTMLRIGRGLFGPRPSPARVSQ